MNPACDPSGFGEGAAATDPLPDVFHGPPSNFTTDANGDLSAAAAMGWSASPPSPGVVGYGFTVTDTLPSNETTEYSNCVPIAADSDGDGIQDSLDWTGGVGGSSNAGSFSRTLTVGRSAAPASARSSTAHLATSR